MQSLDFRADELAARLPAGPLSRVFAYWRTCRDDRGVPGRQHLRPEDIVADLSHLFLIDVEDPGLRLRYRLIGTRVAGWSGGDATGKYLDDPACGENREIFTALVRGVVIERRPCLTVAEPAIFGGSTHLFDRLMLPMARDGRRIDMVLGVADLRVNTVRTASSGRLRS
ncbi:MAG: PAS domain-containing protein [Pseudomonadota bacterium]|nr:PAS domain-containing protein [Pseudomonadota bacterium]